jgi:hypothetical protein
MLTWMKTDRSPLTLQALEAPARISKHHDGRHPIWIAELELPEGGSRCTNHASPQTALAWCERELAGEAGARERAA